MDSIPIRSGDIFALLPYIDLPYKVLEQKGMASITDKGNRRWEKWDYAIDNSESIEPDDCPLFIVALEEGNWEVVVIPAEEVDMEKHTGLREDDGHYDLTAKILWMGDSCDWCGHPVSEVEAPCEACNAVGKAGISHPLNMDEQGGFSFKEDMG